MYLTYSYHEPPLNIPPMKQQHYATRMAFFALICSALMIASCNSKEVAEGKLPNGNTYELVHKMDGNTFDIVSGNNHIITMDPKTKGAQEIEYLGVRPAKMNGHEIYTHNDAKVQPMITQDGMQKVETVNRILSAAAKTTDKAKVRFSNFVIDEKGKVVYYSWVAIAVDSLSTPDSLNTFYRSAEPLVDSLQPLLLSITFAPATVNGVAAPYFINNIPALH